MKAQKGISGGRDRNDGAVGAFIKESGGAEVENKKV